MATVGAAGDVTTVRLSMVDFYDEDLTKTFTLDGAITDAALNTILTDLNDLTNAAFNNAAVSVQRGVTGFRGTALLALSEKVSGMVVLTFERPHPLNALKTVSRAFTIPAYIVSILNQNGSLNIIRGVGAPSSAQEKLGRLIDFLEPRLTYEDVGGVITVGGWTFNESRSGAVTTASVIDGE